MGNNLKIFRLYDIRGIYNKDLTDLIALKIGKALGTFLKGKITLSVGFDTRPSSPKIFKNLVSGLLSTGCNVISIGMVPNPVAYFFALKHKIFGCYVTASHNPVEWNGLKIFKPNGISFTDEIKNVEKIFNSEKFKTGKGVYKENKKAIEEYLQFLKSKVGKIKGKIVIDFLGGAAVSAIEVFKKIGLKIIPLHEKPDASLYGFHRLEPWGDLLKLTGRTVKKEKADFGVAFDCDADRSVFVDSSGKFVDPSILNAIFIEHLLEKRKKGKIVVTFDCASELERIVKNLGGEIFWSRVGHGFIEENVVREKAFFGGEQSSHFYFNLFYPFSDGILSTLILAKILNEKNKKLEELAFKFKFSPIAKLYIDAKDDEKKIKVVEDLRKDFPQASDIFDGFKVWLNEKEWFLIRVSQTLPEVNLCIQANNEKRLEELVKKYSGIVKEKIEKLN